MYFYVISSYGQEPSFLFFEVHRKKNRVSFWRMEKLFNTVSVLQEEITDIQHICLSQFHHGSSKRFNWSSILKLWHGLKTAVLRPSYVVFLANSTREKVKWICPCEWHEGIWGNVRVTPFINLDTSRRREVSLTSRPLYCTCPITHRILGWFGSRFVLDTLGKRKCLAPDGNQTTIPRWSSL